METLNKEKEIILKNSNPILDDIGGFIKYSNFEKKLSIKNRMLLFRQNPKNSYLKSFSDWKKEGIKINKGEKAYKIWIPTIKQYILRNEEEIALNKITLEERNKVQEKKIKVFKKIYFNQKPVLFDISQTNASEEYKKNKINNNIKKDKLCLFESVKKYLEEERIKINFNNILRDEVLGNATPYDEINLDINLNEVEKISTLFHEIGHQKLGHFDTKNKISRSQKEVEAEIFALTLNDYYGNDNHNFSIRYIERYLKNLDDSEEYKMNIIEKVINKATDEINKIDIIYKEEKLKTKKNYTITKQKEEFKKPKAKAFESKRNTLKL